jgi:hypothetical protein
MHPELSKRLVRLQLNEALADPDLFSEKVQLEEISYPTFFIRFVNMFGANRLLRFECKNYDTLPIAIDPIDPVTRKPLPRDEWMTWHGKPFPDHALKGGLPFLCIEGTRDYYTHPQHLPQISGRYWETLRPDMRIPDLIKEIKTKFRRTEWR